MWPTFSACRRKWVNHGKNIVRFQGEKSIIAARAGFDPATIRLSVECSTAEVPRNRRNNRDERSRMARSDCASRRGSRSGAVGRSRKVERAARGDNRLERASWPRKYCEAIADSLALAGATGVLRFGEACTKDDAVFSFFRGSIRVSSRVSLSKD